MVLSKIGWLVGFGVLIGRLDSVLRKYHYCEFFVCFFVSFDDICCAFRWRVCCSIPCLLEAQSLYLSTRIREVEPILHLRAVWYCEPAMTGDDVLLVQHDPEATATQT